MPELPDTLVYIDALRRTIAGEILISAQLRNPFILRSVEVPVEALRGECVRSISHIGKQIVISLSNDLYMIVHLMIAGRLRWLTRDTREPGRITMAVFGFDGGRLVITEAGKRKRASVHVVKGEDSLAVFDRGGIDVMQCDDASFASALLGENHTLKRALTDPRLFSGVGNAYSDEIIHAARLSPIKHTNRLTSDEVARLHQAVKTTLNHWTTVLRMRFSDRFPGAREITAFREEFAVHGRFGMPCPACGQLVQRIVYAESETNYCPQCQTGGKILADRSLSRLLMDDWPRALEGRTESES